MSEWVTKVPLGHRYVLDMGSCQPYCVNYSKHKGTFPEADSCPQKFLKTSRSLGDTGGAVFQSFSGYASKLEVSPSPHTLGTMGGYDIEQSTEAQLEGRGVRLLAHLH